MSEIWFLKCLVLNGFIINIKVKSFKIPNGLFKLLKSRGWQKSVIEAVKVEMQNTLKLTIDNKIAG